MELSKLAGSLGFFGADQRPVISLQMKWLPYFKKAPVNGLKRGGKVGPHRHHEFAGEEIVKQVAERRGRL